jgi:hypothetical protein
LYAASRVFGSDALGVRGTSQSPERVDGVLDTDIPDEMADERKKKPESPHCGDRRLLASVLVEFRYLICHEEHDNGAEDEVDDHVHNATESVVAVTLEVLTGHVRPEERPDAERDDGQQDREPNRTCLAKRPSWFWGQCIRYSLEITHDSSIQASERARSPPPSRLGRCTVS